ncbi:MAG: UvrB/UvrC motif-containing protein [Candidatus Latescibacteria bacterium]|nr:UvrB/UvrC motif-containing protein [Candidatus Latescibacterota bacterium]
MKNDDIGHILSSWPHDPDEDLIVRIVEGGDGPKLQMRIDMGVIQMNLDGNPTGESPEGFESWFEFYQNRRKREEDNEIDDFFSLDENDCKLLRQEAVHYYYRYLCLMKLGDHPRVLRDTDRNLRLFAFIKRYGSREMDRWALDQYRPYVIMMNVRARAALAVRDKAPFFGAPGDDADTEPSPGADDLEAVRKAIDVIDGGIGKIVRFYEEYGIASEMDSSVELTVLKALKKEFMRIVPLSLEEQLEKAISEERFEDAAGIRDMIRERKSGS